MTGVTERAPPPQSWPPTVPPPPVAGEDGVVTRHRTSGAAITSFVLGLRGASRSSPACSPSSSASSGCGGRATGASAGAGSPSPASASASSCLAGGEAHFVRSGVLQPGEYHLRFNVEALSVSYTDDFGQL